MNHRRKLRAEVINQMGGSEGPCSLATKRGTKGRSSRLFSSQGKREGAKTQNQTNTTACKSVVKSLSGVVGLTGPLSRRFDGDPCGEGRYTGGIFSHHGVAPITALTGTGVPIGAAGKKRTVRGVFLDQTVAMADNWLP